MAACGSDAPTSPPPAPPGPTDNPAGSFSLTSVDGKTLPVAVLTDTLYSIEVTGSTVQLAASKQFVIAVTTRETVAGYASTYIDSLTGTWSQSAGTVSMTLDPGQQNFAASWDGTRLTLALEVATAVGTYVYTKGGG